MNIVQIATAQWRGNNDKLNFTVLGLGEDGQVYKWVRNGARWKLYDDSEFKQKEQERSEGF